VNIGEVFTRCRAQDRAAFIPYLMAGDPDLAATPALLGAAAAGGADLIEVGIPYSDPLADGPTIQAAAARALASGTTFDAVLAMTASVDRSVVDVPLIAFTYYNPVFVRGLARTADDLAGAGFSGAIIPDLPPEEAEPLRREFARAGVDVTFLVAPTTPIERVRKIARCSGSFVYVVSRMGVTGAGRALGPAVEALVSRLRPVVDLPLAVGFGVSSADQVRSVAAYADGVIVGSALIDRIAAAEGTGVEAAASFCRELSDAVRAGRVAAQRVRRH